MSFHARMDYSPAKFHKSERRLADAGEPFAYTPEHQAAFDRIVTHYPPERRKSAILYALYLVQAQQGYVSRMAMRFVAQQIGCTPAEVEDVVTYYVMFFQRPVGTYALAVCRTLSCALNGAERVTEALSDAIGVPVGGTDPTGTFTLLEFECLGACDRAPVVMINNDHWQERLTPDRVPQFVEDLRVKGLAALTGCHHTVE
ncbi:MAG: NADH-quinone oxidoreductase subunit NuoE [Vicinamibacterales bacterium]